MREVAGVTGVQELQNKKSESDPDFLKRGVFREVSSRAQDSVRESHNLFCD
jgi:hypothetical protein